MTSHPCVFTTVANARLHVSEGSTTSEDGLKSVTPRELAHHKPLTVVSEHALSVQLARYQVGFALLERKHLESMARCERDTM